MLYREGRLVTVGNMDVFYGRRGRVTHTLGHINPLNPVYGPCGVIASNYYGQRYYGIDTRYGTVYRHGGRNGRRVVGDDWDDDWDDDDTYRNGRRSRE